MFKCVSVILLGALPILLAVKTQCNARIEVSVWSITLCFVSKEISEVQLLWKQKCFCKFNFVVCGMNLLLTTRHIKLTSLSNLVGAVQNLRQHLESFYVPLSTDYIYRDYLIRYCFYSCFPHYLLCLCFLFAKFYLVKVQPITT